MIYTRKVVEVIDGDTFRVDHPIQNFIYVRIAEKNAPEKGRPGYEAAKIKLKKELLGKNVKIEPVSVSYNRIVANVLVG